MSPSLPILAGALRLHSSPSPSAFPPAQPSASREGQQRPSHLSWPFWLLLRCNATASLRAGPVFRFEFSQNGGPFTLGPTPPPTLLYPLWAGPGRDGGDFAFGLRRKR